MFDRRINRIGYLLGNVYLWLMLLGGAGIASIADAAKGTSWEAIGTIVGFVGGLLIIAAVVVLLPITFSLAVRRLHDVGRSWAYLLLTFIPFGGILLGLYLLFARGESAPNQYGLPVRDNRFFVVLGPQKPRLS
ncbi:MAG: spoU [Candidatus Saccharibacteria bacterium]|nr:spoU [Candidatus Saccharibacteria bacterium]